jgi:hypothetical protein
VENRSAEQQNRSSSLVFGNLLTKLLAGSHSRVGRFCANAQTNQFCARLMGSPEAVALIAFTLIAPDPRHACAQFSEFLLAA